MTLTARKADLDARRDVIIDAALEVFASRGFYGARLPDIVNAAGVAVGTIYLHFRTKEDLVNAVYQRCQNDYLRACYADFDPSMSWKDVLFDCCRRVASYTAANPTVMRFLELHEHGPYLDAESRALQQRHVNRIDGYFQHGIETGEVADRPSEVVVATASGVITGMIRAHAAGRLELSPETADTFGQILWNAFRDGRGKRRR